MDPVELYEKVRLLVSNKRMAAEFLSNLRNSSTMHPQQTNFTVLPPTPPAHIPPVPDLLNSVRQLSPNLCKPRSMPAASGAAPQNAVLPPEDQPELVAPEGETCVFEELKDFVSSSELPKSVETITEHDHEHDQPGTNGCKKLLPDLNLLPALDEEASEDDAAM